MFFLIFIGISSSAFVRYGVTSLLKINPTNDEGIFNQTLSENPLIVAFVGPEREIALTQAFYRAETLFPNVKFIHFQSANFKKNSQYKTFIESHHNKAPNEPYLAIFNYSTLTDIVGPIDEFNTLLYSLDIIFHGQRPILNSQSELIAALGECPITIISTSKKYNQLKTIVKAMEIETDPLNIALISPKVATDLSLKATDCAIHKRIDNVLEAFDCSLNDFNKKAKSTFAYATKEKLHSSKHLCVIFNSLQITGLHSQFLYTVGDHFKDFDFFYTNNDEMKQYIMEFIQDQKFFGENSLAIIDFKNNYFYKTDDFITSDLRNESPFNSQNWVTNTAQLLYQVRQNKIAKIPRSEDPLPLNYDLAILKLVGSNFKSVVLDNKTVDNVVLYVKPKSSECADAFRNFQTIAEDAFGQNNTQIQFAFMDSTVNQIKGGLYPLPGEPAILIYPSADKSKPRFVVGKLKAADIQLSINLFASNPVKFNNTYVINQTDVEDFRKSSEIIKKALQTKTSVAQNKLLMETIALTEEEYIKRAKIAEENKNLQQNEL